MQDTYLLLLRIANTVRPTASTTVRPIHIYKGLLQGLELVVTMCKQLFVHLLFDLMTSSIPDDVTRRRRAVARSSNSTTLN